MKPAAGEPRGASVAVADRATSTHTPPAPLEDQHPRPGVGVAFGVAAYAWWGIAPLYWKLLDAVPPVLLLAHRIVFAALFFWGLVALRRRLPELRAARGLRVLAIFAASGLLLATNWFLFVFAVITDRVLEASLGYFVNPLLNVLLGMLFLGERLRPLQSVAVVLAIVGVAVATVAAGSLPWISLALAFSFGLYGLVRKTAPLGPLLGSAVETAWMLPFGIGYLALATSRGTALEGLEPGTSIPYLLGTGLVTAIPLLCFSAAARRITLTTLGFLQYLAPTGQFLLAVAVFAEAVSPLRWIAFVIIWVALAVFSADAVRRERGRRSAERELGC